MEKLIRSSEIRNTPYTEAYFNHLYSTLQDEEGTIYHSYPIVSVGNGFHPDISIVMDDFGVLLVHICKYPLSDIIEMGNGIWTINSGVIDSPLSIVEDCAEAVKYRLNKYRQLRSKYAVISAIAFPGDSKENFQRRFGDTKGFLFGNPSYEDVLSLFPRKLNGSLEEKSLFWAVIQGAGPLNTNRLITSEEKAEKIGAAISLLDHRISMLDKNQQKAALQIPDGPQRIRGMAGTGKTVILAMKAANLHSMYPDKKILYTFYTQALYNQVKNLITKFYRENEDKDPNWDNLLVLHSWGGKAKEGVYYRACLRNSKLPRSLRSTPFGDDPLDFICSELLSGDLDSEYDFVLIDEAQDFPPSFFKMIHKLTKDPKRIIFAYDEMQSLDKIQIRDTRELFGVNSDGSNVVDFSAGTYYGGIEMDYVLDVSYRNPMKLLMTAHAIGLGIYNIDEYMQITDDPSTWRAIGYEIEQGDFSPKSQMVIYRSPEKSRSIVENVYSGKRSCLQYLKYTDSDKQLEEVAELISKDIYEEGVQPHHIVVVSLKLDAAKNSFLKLQMLLHGRKVPSIIPGVGGIDRDKFGETGFVTLATVFKAKGNEAFVIYVVDFEALYDYVEFIQSRNRAFTSLTRAKGWCTITGVGKNMEKAMEEIRRIESNLPYFKFTYPDASKIKRKLSQEEHARRKQEVKTVKESVSSLLSLDQEAIASLPPEQLTALIERLKSVRG